MEYIVFDIETNGLDATLIHCVSVNIMKDGKSINKFTMTDPLEIKEFFEQNERPLVGHNIIIYDIPTLKRLYGIVFKCAFWDTLAYSWYLYPNRLRHGLEIWGDELGVPKPKIEDWENLKIEDYVHRCESDVEINTLLFLQMLEYLRLIYDTDILSINRILNYLSFKMDCAREQEEVKWRLDIEKCKTTLIELGIAQKEKVDILSRIMPPNIKYRVLKKPSKMIKKDGSESAMAIKWYTALSEEGYPRSAEGPIKVAVSQEIGNPGSHSQLKDWLDVLGWKPITFKVSKATGEKVPQVSLPNGGGICPSVKKLYTISPNLKELEGLYIINHRIGVFNTFLSVVDENGFVKAKIKGLTNTLRFQHTDIVNLPGAKKPYGKEIRGSLIAPDENHILCGSDVSSLEDSTKQHYMYYFDPDYVNEMRVPGFDPHLDVAVLAEMLTKEEAETYKELDRLKGELDKKGEKLTKDQLDILSYLGGIRSNAKVVNFSGVYGAGPAKIAETLGSTFEFAEKLHTTYWERNKAVKQVAKSLTVKTIYTVEGGVKKEQMWQYNPVSRFWYSLRADKDRFSTLNQGTGVYVFDTWVRHIRSQGIKMCGQFHDEIIAPLLKEKKELFKQALTIAMEKTNQEIQLNVPIGFSIDFGNNYSEIH